MNQEIYKQYISFIMRRFMEDDCKALICRSPTNDANTIHCVSTYCLLCMTPVECDARNWPLIEVGELLPLCRTCGELLLKASGSELAGVYLGGKPLSFDEADSEIEQDKQKPWQKPS